MGVAAIAGVVALVGDQSKSSEKGKKKKKKKNCIPVPTYLRDGMAMNLYIGHSFTQPRTATRHDILVAVSPFHLGA